MGRDVYAFRDLDEELHAFIDDDTHRYEPHSSPPDAKGKSAKSKRTLNGLSESTMLKMYVDHHKAQRRRKLLGGALFVGVALLGITPMLMDLQSGEDQSALELALSAPYRSMRVRGESDPTYDPTARDSEDEALWISHDANVGDVDPHDTGVEVVQTDANGMLDRKPLTFDPNGDDDEDEEGTEALIQEEPTLDSVDDEGRQTLVASKYLRAGKDGEKDDDGDDEPSGKTSI